MNYAELYLIFCFCTLKVYTVLHLLFGRAESLRPNSLYFSICFYGSLLAKITYIHLLTVFEIFAMSIFHLSQLLASPFILLWDRNFFSLSLLCPEVSILNMYLYSDYLSIILLFSAILDFELLSHI
jgi:hypothetical protein